MRKITQTVIVMRHAERADDAPGYDGAQVTDPPITATGEQTTTQVAHRISKQCPVSLVVTSPFLRCVQTASLAARAWGAQIVYDNGLTEVHHPSKVKGCDSAPRLSPAVPPTPCNVPGPRWMEDTAEADARFLSAMQRILREYHTHRTICLVTHGDGVSTLARSGLTPSRDGELIVYNVDYNGYVVLRMESSPRVVSASGVAWTGAQEAESSEWPECEEETKPLTPKNNRSTKRATPPQSMTRLSDTRLEVVPIDSPHTSQSCCGCLLQ